MQALIILIIRHQLLERAEFIIGEGNKEPLPISSACDANSHTHTKRAFLHSASTSFCVRSRLRGSLSLSFLSLPRFHLYNLMICLALFATLTRKQTLSLLCFLCARTPSMNFAFLIKHFNHFILFVITSEGCI